MTARLALIVLVVAADDHELRERDDGKRRPAPRVCGLHFGDCLS
jgi:hypothetical protein